MAPYLGDIAEDATIAFVWSTYDASGASVTRATDGTIKVRRLDDGTDCTGTSVTDTEDTPDTGLHECKIDTSDNANFTTGDDYAVWLDGAVVDSQTVNAVLATFSIENRFTEVTVTTNSDKTGYTLTNLSDANAGKLEDILDGTGGTGLKLNSLIIDGTAAGGVVDIDNAGGPGIVINGSTLGVNIDGAAGAGMAITGTSIGLDVNATAGIGVDIDGTTGGITANASAGPGVWVQGTTYGLRATATAGSGVQAGGTTYGLRATASAGQALSAAGTGGPGLYVTGSSYGAYFGASAGPGLLAAGTTYGLRGTATAGPGVSGSSTNGAGLSISGTTYGMYATASAGPAIAGVVTAGTGSGLQLTGYGSGHGMSVAGGATGHGLYCFGGATSGDGIYAAGQTLGDGMTLVAAGALQYDLNADIKGDITGSLSGAVLLPTIPTDWITADGIATDAFGALELAAGAAAEIADAVWDELAAGHTDAGKAGEQLWTDIDAVLVGSFTAAEAVALGKAGQMIANYTTQNKSTGVITVYSAVDDTTPIFTATASNEISTYEVTRLL